MHWLLILVTSLKGMPPLYRWWGSLFKWVGAFHVREVDYIVLLSDMGLLTHFTPAYFVWHCLLWPSSVIGHIPVGVHYLPASMGIDIIPSALCTCSFWGLQPNHVTCGLHPSSVDALVDIHGRSCNFPFFNPREALLVGCQVTTLPFSFCGILFFPPLTQVVLHGVGLVHLPPCMTPGHTQGNTKLWIGWHCRHVLFQPNEMASQLFCLLPASQSCT